jgi:hypothetical protein
MRRRPPFTVVAYMGVFVLVVCAALIDAGAELAWFVVAVLLGAGLAAMYYRSRIAWILLTALQGGQLVAALAAGTRWWVVAILIAQLALLLAPPTRRYFRRDPPGELGRAARLGRAFRVVSAVAAGLLVGLWGLGAAFWPDPISGELDLVRSERHGIRVLFVGNSLTSENGMIDMLRDLAQNDPQSVPIFPVQYARRGSTLRDAEDDSRLLNLIADERWNNVVLQEHSQVASRPGYREGRMFPEAAALDMLTELSRSQTLLFMTGAYEDGDQDNVPGDSYEAMQERIEYAYTQLGARIRNPVVPVGIAWKAALERDAELDLWEDDGRRPSEAGSYLTACVFYAFLERREPVASSFTAGLERAEARLLARVAWRSVNLAH